MTATPHRGENVGHLNDLRAGGNRVMDELSRFGAVKAIGIGVNENAGCMDALEISDWDVLLLAGCYTLLQQTAGKTWNVAKAPPRSWARPASVPQSQLTLAN